MDELTTQGVFLGAGGAGAGLVYYEAASSCAYRVLQLEIGQSVYAASAAGDFSTVVAGTRTGEVFVLHHCEDNEPASQQPVCLVVGSPVLATCYLSDTAVVTSDAAGRCLLWPDLRDGASPRVLRMPRGILVGLACLGPEQFAGLHADGLILFWHLPEGELTGEVRVPRPGSQAALVGLTRWHADGSLVFPAFSGDLVRCKLESEEVHIAEAHRGEFCAVAEVHGGLITIGRDDRKYRLWQPDLGRVISEGTVPDDIVSCAALDDQAGRILCVSASGRAASYQITDTRLEPESTGNDGDYRVVVGPGLDTLRSLRIQREAEEVRRLGQETETRLRAGAELDEVEDHLRRIAGLGYEHVCLAIRADYARSHEDLLSELAAQRRLAEILPVDREETYAIRGRYAEVLARLWLLDDSLRVRERLPASASKRADDELLRHRAALMHDTNWMVVPGVPVGMLIEAANLVGQAFVGRFVLNTLSGSPCHGVSIESTAVAGFYSRNRGESPGARLPGIRTEMLWWLSSDRAVETEALLLDNEGDIESLTLAIQILNDGTQSVVVPAAAFVAPRPPDNVSVESHNRRMACNLEEISRGTLSNAWLNRVYAAVRVAIGQTINVSSVKEPV